MGGGTGKKEAIVWEMAGVEPAGVSSVKLVKVELVEEEPRNNDFLTLNLFYLCVPLCLSFRVEQHPQVPQHHLSTLSHCPRTTVRSTRVRNSSYCRNQKAAYL